jgi:glucose-6-phosphate 1-dehydrogenase
MSLRPPADQDIVIVGGTGDLARRKLLPALYNLCRAGLLPARGPIVGFARSQLSDDQFRGVARDAVEEHSRTGLSEDDWSAFASRLQFVCAEPEGYAGLARHLGQPSRLIYVATPPSTFPEIVRQLGQHGLAEGASIVIEKPFGRDLESARSLDRALHSEFDESQIFRIDHYLGKETVQNILVFRFGNAAFERIWNRDAIEQVQITVAESIGIEGRGAFYEETGALRDIIQNHALQVLALLAMEPPSAFEAEAIRDEKAKLLHVINPVDPARVVRGQYAAGTIDGRSVRAYRDEEGTAGDSTTETFAALELCVDNWRWAGVPFFLRAGKRMPTRCVEIQIAFRDVPVCFFRGTDVAAVPANHLTIRVQPEESITFTFLAKVPGPEVAVQPVQMQFSYGESFMVQPPEAYERLLHDAMDGDAMLFARRDGVERAWAVVEPALQSPAPLCLYPAGSWGPREADDLIAPGNWHLR